MARPAAFGQAIILLVYAPLLMFEGMEGKMFGPVALTIIFALSASLLLSLTGLDIITAFSAVVASINNTGPGLGQVGPSTTFTSLNDFQTWVCTFAMLLGRLEIFTLLVVLTPAFWRK